MRFDINSKTGEVEDVFLKAGDWICRGDNVKQESEGEIEINPGSLTTCPARDPHYSIRCRRIRIRLNNDLVATHVTFYAGRTPVFWLPVLATPLKEFRLPLEVQVGRTSQLGMFVRTSPAYEFVPNFPGQAHLDYFAYKGWGYGLTQEMLDTKGKRIMRAHAYQINERTLSYNAPRHRWELFAEGSRTLRPGSHLALNCAYVSDAHFRELYGNRQLPLPLTAGQRFATGAFSQRLPFASANVTVRRMETQRAPGFSLTTTGRFALSQVDTPDVNVIADPVELADWLEAGARFRGRRSYSWENEWYVNEYSARPALEAHTRAGFLGSLVASPALKLTWRDRGDRVPRFLDGVFAGDFLENDTRGLAYRAEAASSLKRSLPLVTEMSLSHAYARRLNKIGYDPFGYRGLDTHIVSGRLFWRLSSWATASVGESYDLRNRQDPVSRRWGPLTPQIAFNPHPGILLTAQGEYDFWWAAFRRADAALSVKDEDAGINFSLRPTYIDNKLLLPRATTTSRDYLITREIYFGSEYYLSPLVNRRLIYLDAIMAFPLTSRLKAEAIGQLDLAPPPDIYLPPKMRGYPERHIRFYTLRLVRDLHCWELTGTFERYISGEFRFYASINLKVFPTGRIPLLTF